MKACLFILLLAGCRFLERHPEKRVEANLEDLHATWVHEIEEASDPDTGWPSATDCDGTLWAGEAYAAGATSVQIDLAEHAPGEIHRRPFTSCYPGESRSTVSQDMLTGYLWALWRKGDYGATARLADYGEHHDVTVGWVMGEPYPLEIGAVLTRPTTMGTVGRMLFILSDGRDARSYRTYPSLYPAVSDDYARHILVLSILLTGEVNARRADYLTTSIDGESLALLREQVAYDPGDALFQAALSIYTGDAAEAVRLLKDSGYACPSYVRGDASYCTVHKAFAASILLAHNANI